MAGIHLPLPRIPQALARQQEAYPLVPIRKGHQPIVLGKVIDLKAMCAKWWLERVQFFLRRDVSKPKLFCLQRFLTDLPRELRFYIIQNALKAGGLHLAHGSKEIPSVNRALVFLSSDIRVNETVFITIPKPGPDGIDWPPELELICRSGEGIQKMVFNLPIYFCESVKRLFVDICRTCRQLSEITINEACDEALFLITRYCLCIKKLDVSNSQMVTDEGIARSIVNFKWLDKEGSSIKFVDVSGTSVTQDGLVQLISRLPSITSFGSTDIIEALEAVLILSEDQLLSTALEEATLKCTTINRIKTLRKYCPNLNSITAVFQEHPGATLNDLRLLTNLAHISITVREPFLMSPANLHDLAWAIGPKLQTLKISGDVFFEVDLGTLVGQCPNLRKLTLPAITVLTKESLQVLEAKDTLTLRQLTHLEMDCMTGVGPKAWAKDFNLVRRGLVLALKRCTLLQKLVLRPTCIVDIDLIEVLAENRLANLEVLELYNSTLGLSCATLIVDTCVNLHVMKGIRTWRGMTLHDTIMLRKHTRGHKRAADLKIVP